MSEHRRIAPGAVALVGGFLFIIAATLSPFNFHEQDLTWVQYFRSFKHLPSSPLDFPRNVALFAPLGWGLASSARHRSLSARATFLLVFFLGFLISICVESLQIWLPVRRANYSDVVANTLGALTGSASIFIAENGARLAGWRMRGFTSARLVAVSVVYLLGALLVIDCMFRGLRPGNWNPSYPLAVGNELTQDRPWRGTVEELVILDRAVDAGEADQLTQGRIPVSLKQSVVAMYPLGVSTGNTDGMGLLPPLKQYVTTTDHQGDDDIRKQLMWLKTESGVCELAHRVNRSRQFTLVATIATGSVMQTGPARIITISRDPFERNLTLGQESDSLVVRWRSFLTGNNGATPELHFPAVFSLLEPQRIVVSTDGTTVTLATRHGARRISLGPEIALVAMLREGTTWRVEADALPDMPSAALFAFFVFLPLGLLIGMAPPRTRRATHVELVLVVFSPLVLGIFVAVHQKSAMDFRIVILGTGMASVGCFLSRHWWDSARR